MDTRVYQALKEGATLVTAGNRLARTLRREFQAMERARGAAAWTVPAILPWSGWMDALWLQHLYSTEGEPPVRINAAQERVLWEAAVRDSGELLQSGAAAKAAQQAWRLMQQWRLDLAEVEAAGNEDARAFAGWARRFRQSPWLEEARLPDVVRDARPAMPARVLLAGFEEFSPQQSEFLAACRTEVLPPPVCRERTAVRVAFPDPEQELAAAARWALAQVEAGEQRVGVVIPDLEDRRALVARMFREFGVPVNISAGIPLSDYPVVRCALHILDLDFDGNAWSLMGSLARARYLAGSDRERSHRGLLDAAIRRRGQMELSLGQVRRMAAESECPVLARAIQRFLRARSALGSRQRPSEWSRGFGLLLRAFGWPGERGLDSPEYQTVEAWREALSNFAAMDLTAGTLGYREAVALLRRMVAERPFQPETDAAPVEVLGVLEASGLRFDHLWVAGLDDESWPGPPKPNPFLPVRLQRERGLPRCSPERELQFAARMTGLLLTAAPDVVVSHPLGEQDRELAPSPLILRIPRGEVRLAVARPWREVVLESGRLESLDDNQGPPVDEIYQRGGTRVFRYQAACPFRAFAELRLGARELEEPAPGLDVRARGILVHAALESVWKRLGSHAGLCAADLEAVVGEAVGDALARLRVPLAPRFAALERRRLEALVAEWLEMEKQRAPFEVVEPEAGRYVELGGIRAKVVLDRIDRLPDGREIIIDYKTGKQGPGDWEGERPNEPQLPLYSVTREAPLAGVLFARVRAGESGFAGLAEAGVEVPGARPADLNELRTVWRAVLERLAADFRAGRADVDPKNEGLDCRRCPLAGLCRIAEHPEACQEVE